MFHLVLVIIALLVSLFALGSALYTAWYVCHD